MSTWFSNHERKRFKRSPTFSRNITINVVMILFIVMMLLYVVGFGFIIDLILIDQYPEQDVISVFNGFILFYLLGDLVMRFYLQEVPALEVQPYLHLPIKRGAIVHFILRKSVFTLFNLPPLILMIPFLFKKVIPAVGVSDGILWATTIYLFAICNTYITVYLKKKLVARPQISLYFVLASGLLFLLDQLGVIPLSSLSAYFFGSFSLIAVLVPLIVDILLYVLNFKTLKASMYLEELGKMRRESANWTGDLSFLKRFGDIGDLVALELKLILRNKRPRSVIFVSLAFLFYGLIFYTNESYMNGYGMLIFVGVFVTGSFMMNYGQLAFSWESGFFDTILTKRIDIRKYLEAKYNLLAISCLASFILTTPYAFFGWKVLLINTACFLFNVGINTIVVLYLTGKSPKKIDISNPNVMNWEGMGATQFILVIPVLVAPVLIYLGFMIFDLKVYGIVCIGVAGLLGILLKRQLLNYFYTHRFLKNKYQIAQSLRIE